MSDTGLYIPHLRRLIQEALPPPLYSLDAEELLLGTIAVESRCGHYLRQLGTGPALGICQMEPATFRWMRMRYGVLFGFAAREPEELVWDLRLSLLTARLRYFVDPAPLPSRFDVDGMGKYWKRVYNSIHGAGTVEKFMQAYDRYVR